MSYRILEGRLHKQAVRGGRWEAVEKDEENRVLDAAASLLEAEASKRASACRDSVGSTFASA